MKSKKSLYILLPLALIIWGLIAYKIVTGINNNEEPPVFSSDSNTNFLKTMDADTFSLILAYRDPFLGNNLYLANGGSSNQIITSQVIPKTIETPKPIVAIDCPNIKYLGLILNKKNGQYVSLMNIEKKEFLMLEGQEINGVKILKAFKDSVIIQYKKEIKIYKK